MACTIFKGGWGQQGTCTQITAPSLDDTCTPADQIDFKDFHPAGAENGDPNATGALNGTDTMNTPVGEVRLNQTRCPWISCHAGERRRV